MQEEESVENQLQSPEKDHHKKQSNSDTTEFQHITHMKTI